MQIARTDASEMPIEADASLLLREFAHRAMNELAVARSAVSIARRALPGGALSPSAAMLDGVAARLDASGGVMRMLSGPVAPRVDLGVELAALSRAVLGARPEAAALRLDLAELWVDGDTARRVALIAAEFMGNACRHAFAGGAGTLSVTLWREGSGLVLEVADDVNVARDPRTSGTGFGSGIVAGLARALGGSVALDRGRAGSVARLSMPVDRAGAADHAH